MKKPKKRRFGKFIILLFVFCLGASCAGHGSKNSTQQPATNQIEQPAAVTTDETNVEATVEEATAEETVAEEEKASEAEKTEAKKEEKKKKSEKKKKENSEISPDFKAAMDSYEAFFDEYVSFMNKYAESDKTDMNMLLEYTNYLSKYAEAMEKMEAIEDSDMNDAELAYYIDVTARIEKKLLEVASEM
ncbi:MAG: hypothetical protein MJ097_04610 [Dorea sp.]|nr:hypothetical protein [Dorea sp.]